MEAVKNMKLPSWFNFNNLLLSGLLYFARETHIEFKEVVEKLDVVEMEVKLEKITVQNELKEIKEDLAENEEFHNKILDKLEFKPLTTPYAREHR